MNIAPLVAQHVDEVVHGNWTDIFLDDVAADITYEEAITLPPGITNSIAMLVNHLEFYNNIVMERLKGESPAIDDSNGFNIDIHDDEEWQQLKMSTISSFRALSGIARELSNEKLLEPTPGGHDTIYKTLHGISEHAHYHLGKLYC